MQHAIDITSEALMRSMGMIGKANWEYEVHAEVDYTFRRRNADYWGYPSIVGCGGNATTLHYVESQGAVKKGDLMLMDVGAEYDHYTADVTRTFPVNGKFSKEQAEIYQIVYDAQEAAAKTIKPGARFGEPASAALGEIKNGLAKLGLITAPDAKFQADFNGRTVEIDQYRLWYMHGWGHWLGMNVHDVGGGREYRFERRNDNDERTRNLHPRRRARLSARHACKQRIFGKSSSRFLKNIKPSAFASKTICWLQKTALNG